jgi:hypothetical protein
MRRNRTETARHGVAGEIWGDSPTLPPATRYNGTMVRNAAWIASEMNNIHANTDISGG